MPGVYSDQIANSLKGAPVRAVDTDRAFINMVLTKGEADQRGSRRARCVRRGTFQDGTIASGRQAGMHTPSNHILTKNKLLPV